jgi:PIN domain nuclease of toxin-antitoxin system
VKGYLLDTHAWLWAQRRDLANASAKFLSEVEQWQQFAHAYISDVSVLELARLSAALRIDLGTSIDQFVHDATRDDGLQLLPLTTRILIESTRLPGEIHRDPSDRLLVATAREHGLTLVTRDKDLLAYGRKGHLSVLKL